MVSHELLMTKLEQHLPRWLTTWIATYLIGRKQRVKTPNHTTEWHNVEAGVIQGSVLGPILFIIFLSDINSFIPNNIQAPKYADDIATYCIYKEDSQNNIQEAADGVSKWAKQNKMKLNINKTQHMVINSNEYQEIKIDGQQISNTTSYKYLGTQVNDQLNWDAQWNYISPKFNSTLYLIKTLKNISFKKEILITVYRSLVQSQVISNAITLCSTSKRVQEEMEATHKRFLKVIGVNETEIRKYKIETMSKLVDEHCKKTLSKILNNEEHPTTKTLEKRESHTRNKFPFRIHKCNGEKYQNSFLQKYIRKLEQESYTATNTKKTIINQKIINQVKCEICSKRFDTTRGLNSHTRIKHNSKKQQRSL
jgi:hypothetical protein